MNWTKANQLPDIDIFSVLRGREETVEKFLKFAADRMNIFWSRVEGKPYPWTDDPILGRYKFTNCYRILDRVSQYLITNISNNDFNSGEYGEEEKQTHRQYVRFGQTYLFKMFNNIKTWRAMPEELKYPVDDFFGPWPIDKIRRWAEDRQSWTAIFGNAYIMCPPDGITHTTRVQLYLDTFKQLCADNRWKTIMEAKELDTTFVLLKQYLGFGDFLAYQFALDFGYGAEKKVNYNSFTVPGPGCQRGMQKVFGNIDAKDMPSVLKGLYANQKEIFSAFGVDFKWLSRAGHTWRLQTNDFQNLFCEFDKYSRATYPELRTERKRQINIIKNPFAPTGEIEGYEVPRNWIN